MHLVTKSTTNFRKHFSSQILKMAEQLSVEVDIKNVTLEYTAAEVHEQAP